MICPWQVSLHAAEGYITKLLNLGHKVAICDQLEAPQPDQACEERYHKNSDAGTVLEDRQLDAGHNHFLLAVDFDQYGARASWLELSTGKFVLAQSDSLRDFLSILGALSPREVLLPEGMFQRISKLDDGSVISNWIVYLLDYAY